MVVNWRLGHSETFRDWDRNLAIRIKWLVHESFDDSAGSTLFPSED